MLPGPSPALWTRTCWRSCGTGSGTSRPENACALTHIEEALMWLNRRVEDRITRGVLGTEQE